HQVERLQQQGIAAFKLDLKTLVDHPIDFGFSDLQRSLYKGWHSKGLAHFFLDSVDEAKLEREADFYRAIERFSNQIGVARARANIVVSSRPNAWLPQRDTT